MGSSTRQPEIRLAWIARLDDPDMKFVLPTERKDANAGPTHYRDPRQPRSSPDLVFCKAQPGRSVTSLAWSPDGKYLAAANTDGTKIWVAGTGKEFREFGEQTGAVTSIAWNPKMNGQTGMLLATGSKHRSIAIWDVAPDIPNVIKRIDAGAPVNCLSWRPDGSRLVAGLDSGWFFVCNPSPGETGGRQRVRCSTNPVCSVAWHPTNARYFAVADTEGMMWIINPTKSLPLCGCVENNMDALKALKLFNPSLRRSAKLLDKVKIVRCRGGTCRQLAWSPDGSHIAIIGSGFGLWRYAPSNSLIPAKSKITSSYRSYSSVAWHPKGAAVAASRTYGTITIWDTSTGTQHTLGRSGSVTAIAWTPDGERS